MFTSIACYYVPYNRFILWFIQSIKRGRKFSIRSILQDIKVIKVFFKIEYVTVQKLRIWYKKPCIILIRLKWRSIAINLKSQWFKNATPFYCNSILIGKVAEEHAFKDDFQNKAIRIKSNQFWYIFFSRNYIQDI